MKDTVKDVLEVAHKLQFDAIEPLNMSSLEFREDVRGMCTAEKCKEGYNKNWSCPPHGPSLHQLERKITSYDKGVILQMIAQQSDPFDFETVTKISHKMSNSLVCLSNALEERNIQNTVIGPGPCQRCKPCTFPDKPCLFPDKRIVSMSACGIFVSKLCTDNNVAYCSDSLTKAFIGCVFFN